MVSKYISAVKPIRILCFLILIISGRLTDGYAQTTCFPTAGATIVNPVSISKNVNSEFGNVAVIVTGTVEIAPVEKSTVRGSIVLPASSGTFTAAMYYFTGSEGYAFTVSSPPKPLVVKNGKKEMHVQSFDSSPIQNESAGMIAGVYISVSPARVTVNYN
jgi:hypothetical protein